MRFGVMCSGFIFQRWQAEAILELKRHGHQPVLMITDVRKEPRKSLFTRLLRKRWSTILYTVLENRLFLPGAKRPVSLAHELEGIDQIDCRVECKGFSEYFSPDDLAMIRSYRLDFILRFGFNILRGEILNAAIHGVWSFHHDDEMKYRGGPAGFWEIRHGDPVSGAILQRLTPRLDGGIILKKGYLQTVKHSWKGNLEQLLMVSSVWPAQVADNLSEPEEGIVAHPGNISTTGAPLYKVPGNMEMILFLWTLIRNRLQFYFNEFIVAEQWNVGIVAKPVHEIALNTEPLKNAEIDWMPVAGRHIYYADPFGYSRDGQVHVLLEEYDYRRMMGHISGVLVAAAHPDGVDGPRQGGGTPSGWWDPVRVVGPRQGGVAGHLSYPYIIENQEEIYCLPEACSSGKLTLYRYDHRHSAFIKEKILLENIEAVDPTLILYQGIWWLFFTERRYSNTHLYLYHSDHITGNYIPHPLNPVKIDIRSARPAGTPFVVDGVLYRPAQDCSKTYGGSVVILKVSEITTRHYTEEIAGGVQPAPDSMYHQGLHTLSQAGHLTLIDGKYYRANWHYFVNQCRKRISGKGSRHD